MMAHFDGHFDNLSAAATNSGAAHNQLAATTKTQYADINSLLTALKNASGLSSYAAVAATDSTPSIPPAESKRRISQLEADISKNWHCGDFCSTYSWGINENHTSNKCRAKNARHVSTATRVHPEGPSRTTNKGWNDFLSRRTVDRT